MYNSSQIPQPLSSLLSQVRITSTSDRYIVQVHPSTLPAVRAHIYQTGAGSSLTAQSLTNPGSTQLAKSIEGQVFTGVVGAFSPAEIKTLQSTFGDSIISVSRDTLVRPATTSVTQPGPLANWGLARISEYVNNLAQGYTYASQGGLGTYIYVIDSGIYTAHSEFNGRASSIQNYVTTETADDYYGHGTFVASVAAGQTYGVAKNATLFSVKILNGTGDGSSADLISALNFVATHATSNGYLGKAVINMSIGSAQNTAVNAAVLSTYQAGLVVIR